LGDVISNGDFESLFIYSSLARERFINQIHLKELESITLLQNSFGGYGYGEFFQSGENSYLLNHSITFLALLESSQNKSSRTIKRRKRYARSKEDTKDLKTIEILSNIAKVSSHELELLNKKLNYKIESGVREMRKKESILIHNSRLAQLGEMLGLIAHQWRQPLSAISATATGMQVKLELDSANKEYLLESLDHIEKYVLHLSETIDDFTNFFKPVKKRENVEIKELIKKALFISSSLLSKNSIELIEKYCSDDKIYTYPNEIVQVILNIIKNSSNALEKNKIPNPEIYINEYKKGDKVVIEISDNAGGIDKKIIDKIFEPYFSTKDSKESMGLGLYMSKFIIEESCQGKLEVENSQRGAKFRITLETIN
jgi:signal transduction histidine kinase